MKSTIFTVLFVALSVVVIALGALQCFAPRLLKQVQDRLPPSGDWSGSTGGALFERMRERQAAHPSPLYRASGLLLMIGGVVILLGALGFFR